MIVKKTFTGFVVAHYRASTSRFCEYDRELVAMISFFGSIIIVGKLSEQIQIFFTSIFAPAQIISGNSEK